MEKAKRHIFVVITMAILAWGLWPASATADIGPKPSLEIRLTGLDDPRDYYLDLLAEYEPYKDHVWEEMEDEPIYQYTDGDRVAMFCHGAAIFGSLQGQFTASGYILHELYYRDVPNEFSIIIQDKATGELIISDVIKTKQLDSIVAYDVSTNQASVIVIKNPIEWENYSTLFRILLTIVIETLIALAFRFKRNIWLPVPVNFFTQFILYYLFLFRYPIYFMENYTTTFLVMEAFIICIEFAIYIVGMGDKKHWLKTLAYTLTANGTTMAIGLWLLP